MRATYEGDCFRNLSALGRHWSASLQATCGHFSQLVSSAQALKLMWAFIGIVSIYDIWLVIAVEDVIFESEQNPICLALIQFDPDHYSLFISAKLAGTLFVIATCQRIVQLRRDIGVSVTTGLTGFQTALLMYLSCG